MVFGGMEMDDIGTFNEEIICCDDIVDLLEQEANILYDISKLFSAEIDGQDINSFLVGVNGCKNICIKSEYIKQIMCALSSKDYSVANIIDSLATLIFLRKNNINIKEDC